MEDVEFLAGTAGGVVLIYSGSLGLFTPTQPLNSKPWECGCFLLTWLATFNSGGGWGWM